MSKTLDDYDFYRRVNLVSRMYQNYEYSYFLEKSHAVTTPRDIQVGEELFIDYGERYWNGKTYSKIHAPNVETLLQVVGSLESKIKIIDEKFENLLDRLGR